MKETTELVEQDIQKPEYGEYGASSITVLEGLEAVRLRPGMYIGSTDVKGLHHLVWEVVDNSIDEHLAGYCQNIEVIIHKDNSISVQDDGRGIPTAPHPKLKISTLEVVLTVLHAGGKFDKDTYKVSGGLHGVGVNALSAHLRAEVHREGKIFVQEFSEGKSLGDIQIIGESTKTGTKITFRPDPTIFEDLTYNHGTLAQRLRELAFLNSGLKLRMIDERSDNHGEEYHTE
jgi:DNA gyrase subunit B